VKPIPAIVESDVEQVAIEIAEAYRALRLVEADEARIVRAAGEHRLHVGRLLVAARSRWPERGPRAKGWGELLKRVGMEQPTAWRYMELAGYVAKTFGPNETPDRIPTYAEAGLDKPRDREVAPVNGNGGSGDPARGTYCTPAKYAAAVGPWDLDPFSNPRSHVVADIRCMLENGGDGLVDPGQPGSCRWGGDQPGHSVAEPDWRVWIQPPYSNAMVQQAIAHYGHTRFCALLRFDPSTEWFAALWKLTRVVAIPFGERIEFEGPPDIETSANPYPHAFYYADERDVTPAIRELCIVLRVDHPNT